MIRISGPGTARCATMVCPELAFDGGWRAALTTLRDADGETLDRVVAVPFPGPRSYTGEDMLEVMVHGSPYVVESLFAAFVGAGR